MLGLILKVIAFILFVVAALNQSLFEQGPADLVAWGLASWVISELLGGVSVSRAGISRD